MDLISRLKFYMEHVGMPSSVFADTAQIPRPTLSQILSGRNKKISNEVIAKLHAAFPSLNIMWLMFGDGDMEVGANIASSEAQINQNNAIEASQDSAGQQFAPQFNFDADDRVFDQSVNQPRQNHQFQANDERFFQESQNNGIAPQSKGVQPLASSSDLIGEMIVNGSSKSRFVRDSSRPSASPAGNVASAQPTPAQADNRKKLPDESKTTEKRRIESIMVFYTDSSFEVFRPAE